MEILKTKAVQNLKLLFVWNSFCWVCKGSKLSYQNKFLRKDAFLELTISFSNNLIKLLWNLINCHYLIQCESQDIEENYAIKKSDFR